MYKCTSVCLIKSLLLDIYMVSLFLAVKETSQDVASHLSGCILHFVKELTRFQMYLFNFNNIWNYLLKNQMRREKEVPFFPPGLLYWDTPELNRRFGSTFKKELGPHSAIDGFRNYVYKKQQLERVQNWRVWS